MKILKTLVANNVEGKIFMCDTISHEGKLWLVPHWFENIIEGWKVPARIIRMDNLKHQKAPQKFEADFVLNAPLPKAVFDHLSPIPKDTSFEIIDAPDIRISTQFQDFDS